MLSLYYQQEARVNLALIYTLLRVYCKHNSS